MTATVWQLQPLQALSPAFERGPVPHSVYLRRRLCAGLLLVALLAALAVAVRPVLADRGGVPASTPAIRPANLDAGAVAGAVAVAVPAVVTYIVQPGDTLWRVAEQFHGRHSVADFVDRLVTANGGTDLQIGQELTIPQ
jgi:nucleoid-associated protein YgaU